MEGVGARLGRSSTRYGVPATVFSGPVRKWKKKWVNIPSPNSNNNNHSTANGGANSNHSHLLLFKWTPISSSSTNGNNNNNGSTPATPAMAGGKETVESAADEAPRRKFRYVPVSAIEDHKQDISAKIDDDAKPSDTDSSVKMQNESVDEKTVTNDVLTEEAETSDKDRAATQDASENSLDLSLGLKAHEGKRETDPRAKGQNEGDVEMNTATSLESGRKGKRKAPAPDLKMRV